MPLIINDQYQKDLHWILSELKQEEITRKSSNNTVFLTITAPSDRIPSKQSQQRVLSMLANEKAINLIPYYNKIRALNAEWQERGYDPVEYEVEILQPKFDDILGENEAIYQRIIDREEASKENIEKAIVFKNNQGDFFINGKLVVINKETIYYKVFNLIYENLDQANFISYGWLNTLLEKKGEVRLSDIEKQIKRITNAIGKQQGFFKYAKVNGHQVENKVVSGMKLIETIRGKGLKMNI